MRPRVFVPNRWSDFCTTSVSNSMSLTEHCISADILFLLLCRFLLEATESNCLDFFYAVSLKSFLNIVCIDDLEIPSWLAVFLMLLRGFRSTLFITACNNWFGTNRMLSTRNRLAGGCSSLCISCPYIEYSLTTHIQLFCYVAVAYFSNNLITICFGYHIAWNNIYLYISTNETVDTCA